MFLSSRLGFSILLILMLPLATAVQSQTRLSGRAAQPPRTLQCSFDGPGIAPITLTVLDENRRKSRWQKVPMSIFIGTQGESPAVATYVSALKSPIGTEFIRIAAGVDNDFGLALQIAPNGEAIAFPYNWEHGEVTDRNGYLGYCDGAAAILQSWN